MTTQDACVAVCAVWRLCEHCGLAGCARAVCIVHDHDRGTRDLEPARLLRLRPKSRLYEEHGSRGARSSCLDRTGRSGRAVCKLVPYRYAVVRTRPRSHDPAPRDGRPATALSPKLARPTSPVACISVLHNSILVVRSGFGRSLSRCCSVSHAVCPCFPSLGRAMLVTTRLGRRA